VQESVHTFIGTSPLYQPQPALKKTIAIKRWFFYRCNSQIANGITPIVSPNRQHPVTTE
jgi:hypothetical protein